MSKEIAVKTAASKGGKGALLHTLQKSKMNSSLEESCSEENTGVSYDARRSGHHALRAYLRKQQLATEERGKGKEDSKTIMPKKSNSIPSKYAKLVGPCEGDDEFVPRSVLMRFELVQKLGHSPWAVVWRAMDKNSRVPVALKKLYCTFDTAERARAAYRELRILEELKGGPNLVHLRHVLLDSEANDGGDDVYLVLGLSTADLFGAIRTGTLKPKHFAYITAQMLRALSYVHARGFVHRDIKPSNFLLNERCEVQLCDFGHARSVAGSDEPISQNNIAGTRFTDYLGSGWYRAPESLLGTNKVGPAVDIWGVGCVLGEMLLGHPVLEGTNTTHQLRLIIELTGYPNTSEITSVNAPFAEEQLAHDVIGPIHPKAMSEVFPTATAEGLDFARRCLQFSPTARFSASSALKHPFVIEYFHECLELSTESTEPAEPFFLNDNVLYTTTEYRHCITENVEAREKMLRRLHGQSGRFGYSLGYP